MALAVPGAETSTLRTSVHIPIWEGEAKGDQVTFPSSHK